MKKLLFLMLAIMPMMLFTSCSDDDDVTIDSPVVGTWVTSNRYLKITETITFHSNGTVTSKEEYNGDVYTDNGKYTVNENVITIYWQGDNEPVILHFNNCIKTAPTIIPALLCGDFLYP